MIELPIGEFVMGAPENEFRRRVVWRNGGYRLATLEDPYIKTDEGPQQPVTIDVRFAIGRNEVTRDEWMACVNSGGCDGYIPPKKVPDQVTEGWAMILGDFPVVRVSYEQALEYVDWLNKTLGTNAYRLPTEAEWEYAARAGTSTRFAQGDELHTDQANFSAGQTEFYLQELRPDLARIGAPVRVTSLDAANDWGVRHMSGNVNEITSSCYSDRLPEWQYSSQWLRESDADACRPSVRGGAYIFPMDVSRVAWRGGLQSQESSTPWTGFRVVKAIED